MGQVIEEPRVVGTGAPDQRVCTHFAELCCWEWELGRCKSDLKNEMQTVNRVAQQCFTARFALALCANFSPEQVHTWYFL